MFRRPTAEQLRILSLGEDEAALRLNERRYRSLVEATYDAVWLADAEGNLLSDIPRWRGVTGQSPDELLGDGWLRAVHPDDQERVAATWGAAVEARGVYEVEYRICGGDDVVRHLEVRGVPVFGADEDQPLEWIGFIEDVTDQRVLEAALEGERRVLQQVIAQAPAGVGLVWGPEHRYRYFNAPYLDLAPDGRIEVGRSVAEATPEAAALVLPMLDRARAGEAVRTQDLRVPFDDERSFEGHRYYDVTFSPVTEDNGRPGGVLVVAGETTEQVRRRSDLERRLQDERRGAEQLQRALLPEAVHPPDGLEVAVRYLPGGGPGVSVGGDWYDLIPLDEGRVAVVVGDVGGRGVEAARIMAQLRSALRAYVLQDLRPAAALEELSRLCFRLDLVDMTTVGVGIVDRRAGTLTYAGAGHHAPLLRHRDGDAIVLAVHRGPPIGVPAARYVDDVIALPPCSTLVLCTDGLIERRDQPLDGMLDRLRLAIESGPDEPEALADHLLSTMLGGRSPEDDVALLVCRTDPVAADPEVVPTRMTGRFPGVPESVAAIRHELAEMAARCGFDEATIAAVALAVTEAATNAIVHAYEHREGDLEVSAEVVDGELQVVIADTGPGLVPRADSPGLGLGLPLMAHFAARMDVVQRDPGTALHLVFRRGGPAA